MLGIWKCLPIFFWQCLGMALTKKPLVTFLPNALYLLMWQPLPTYIQSAPMYVYRFLSELYICLLYSCKSLLVFIISNSNINIKPPLPLVLLAQWPAVCLLVSDEKTINQRRKQQCHGYHRRCGPFSVIKKTMATKLHSDNFPSYKTVPRMYLGTMVSVCGWRLNERIINDSRDVIKYL